MKLSKIILLMVFALFFSFGSQAQAVSSMYEADFVITDLTTNESYTFTAPTHEVLSPNGNFVKSIRIKIPKDHDLMQNFGPFPNKWFEFNYLHIDVGGDGEFDKDVDVKLTDAIAKLNKSGNLHITFHLNGAGTYLPLGW
jgi:hypothetical protein